MWKKRSWKEKISSGKALEDYQQAASQYVENPTLLKRLLDKSQKYLGETISKRVGGAASVLQDIPLLIRLVRSWMTGSYNNVSKKNILIIVAGLLYFISPFDLVPDFLGTFGFLDDLAIFGYILSRLQLEISEFRTWESEHSK